MSAGHVVAEEAVEARTAPGDTAAVRETIGPEAGSPTLRQSVVRFATGRSLPRETGAADEVLFVLGGHGTLLLGGDAHPLEPETGAYLRAGERYEVENAGPGELALVSVLVEDPAPPGPDDEARQVTVRPADRQAATTERAFRIVCDPGVGCGSVTQFVGEIPPVRAPEHFHRYDEVIYVLEGEGTIDIGELHAPLGSGTCIHLPARSLHCLHNTTGDAMRVLGVFRPAGSPAAAYYPDGTLAYGGGEDT
jgi:quercetin dioxygenase-like cupin family protein